MISECWFIPCRKGGSGFGTCNPENQWTWKAMKCPAPGRPSPPTDQPSWREEIKIPCCGGISKPLRKPPYESQAKVLFFLKTAPSSLHFTIGRSSCGIQQRGC